MHRFKVHKSIEVTIEVGLGVFLMTVFSGMFQTVSCMSKNNNYSLMYCQ